MGRVTHVGRTEIPWSCPPERGYPVSCPRPQDPPHYTLCCREVTGPACCHPGAHTVCASREIYGIRENRNFAYDPGQNWTTKWCPDGDTVSSNGCCYSHLGPECCTFRVSYSMFWWATVLIAGGVFLYIYLKRRKLKPVPQHHGNGLPEPQAIPLQNIPPLYPPPGSSNTDREVLIRDTEDTLFDQSQIRMPGATPIAPPTYEESGPPGISISQSEPRTQPVPTEAPPSYESVVNPRQGNDIRN